MLKLIQAGPLGGSPHSSVESLLRLGLAGRRRMPSPSISPHSTKASAKKTRTLANWKYIPEPRASTPPLRACQRKRQKAVSIRTVTGVGGDDNRRRALREVARDSPTESRLRPATPRNRCPP